MKIMTIFAMVLTAALLFTVPSHAEQVFNSGQIPFTIDLPNPSSGESVTINGVSSLQVHAVQNGDGIHVGAQIQVQGKGIGDSSGAQYVLGGVLNAEVKSSDQ